MKTFRFWPAILVCALVSPIGAQPESAPGAPAVPARAANQKPNFSEENLQALATAGAFYEMVRRASSYSGHLVFTKTIVKDGEVISKKVLDYKFTALSDGDGYITRKAEEGVYTVTSGGGENAVTTSESFRGINDGQSSYKFYASKNVWSQQTATDDDHSVPLDFAAMPQLMTLLGIQTGDDFKILSGLEMSNTGKAHTLQRIISADSLESVYDAKSGVLQRFKTGLGEGENNELVWEELRLNEPVDPQTFTWQTPAASKQVSAEAATLKIEF